MENPPPKSFPHQTPRLSLQKEPVRGIQVYALRSTDLRPWGTLWEVNDRLEDLENNFSYVLRCIEEMLKLMGQQTDSPFTHQILECPSSPKYYALPVETFDGSGDPTDHLEIFNGHMAYHGVEDALMCRAFPLTLRKSARKRFGQLPLNNIHNFRRLSTTFVGHFLVGRLTRKPPYSPPKHTAGSR